MLHHSCVYNDYRRLFLYRVAVRVYQYRYFVSVFPFIYGIYFHSTHIFYFVLSFKDSFSNGYGPAHYERVCCFKGKYLKSCLPQAINYACSQVPSSTNDYKIISLHVKNTPAICM